MLDRLQRSPFYEWWQSTFGKHPQAFYDKHRLAFKERHPKATTLADIPYGVNIEDFVRWQATYQQERESEKKQQLLRQHAKANAEAWKQFKQEGWKPAPPRPSPSKAL